MSSHNFSANLDVYKTIPKYNVIFESKERIHGLEPMAVDWVLYECILKIKDGGKTPVSLAMKFIPPHPYAINMPMEKTLKAESISALYGKVFNFLSNHGILFKG